MQLAAKLLTVLGLGALEIWAAIPAGLALNLHPIVVGVVAASGGILGALAVVSLGERVRTWLMQRHGKKGESTQHSLVYRLWHRYGVVGLGLLAPLLIGAPLGAAFGITLGAPSGRLLFWMSIGVIVWSTALTAAATLGVEGIRLLGN